MSAFTYISIEYPSEQLPKLTHEQAMNIATKVAREITESSYKGIIDNVILFGSTLRKCLANDVDLLLVYSGPEDSKLAEYGMATTYDEDTSQDIIDYSSPVPHKNSNAEKILAALGSKKFYDTQTAIEGFKSSASNFWTESRVAKNGRTKFYNTLTDKEMYIDSSWTKEKFSIMITTSQEDARWTTVLFRVREIMKAFNRSIEDTLNIQLIHSKLLDPHSPKAASMRSSILKKTKDDKNDPTFWHEVLTTGKLYNPKTREFDRTVDDEYPGAAEGFRVTQNPDSTNEA